MTTRSHCQALDAQDPLAPLRQQFALPDGVIYLDGNSLGARPVASLARAQQVIAEEWGNGLIRSWNSAGWADLSQRLGNRLAPLIGARDGEVVITDTTSINLFKVLSAALSVQRLRQPNRKVIVSEASNFPTDLYIAEGLTELLQQGYSLRLVNSPDELPQAIDQDVAVVMLTHVNYKTGYMYDMQALTDLFIALVEERCAVHGLELITPREHARRGSHVSFEHPEGYAVIQALIARGVIGDYREPRIMRFGFTPLYTSFTEVFDAVEILGEILDKRTWDQPQFKVRNSVT